MMYCVMCIMCICARVCMCVCFLAPSDLAAGGSDPSLSTSHSVSQQQQFLVVPTASAFPATQM